jgi:hypothetical protein
MQFSKLAGPMVIGVLVAGCFTYTPMIGTSPVPGQRLSLSVSDQGRAALADRVATGVIRIDGTLVAAPDGEYVVAVSDVTTISGTSHWSGERVSINRDHVTGIMQRRFSKGRTAVAVAATMVAVGAFIATRGLFGIGSPEREPGGGPPSGEQ